MRKLIVLFAAGLLAFTSCNQKSEREVKGNTKISGTIENGQGKVIVVGRSVNRRFKEMDKDSIEDKNFVLGFDLKAPEMVYLQIPSDRSSLPVLVEPGSQIKLKVKNDLNDVEIVEGSKATKAFHEFIMLMDSYRAKGDELGQKFQAAQQAGNEAEAEKIRRDYFALEKEKLNKMTEMAEKNTDNLTAAIILESLSYSQDADFPRLKKIYDALDEKVKQSTYAQNAGQKINSSLKTAIGQKAPDFEAPMADGKMLKLSDVLKKNKVVLLDFWASWCKPCRVENPYVVEIYRKYKDKGFQIIGISLDRPDARDKWLKAIKDDQLEWLHVSNLKYWQDPVARLYGVTSIPSTFILDRNGVIRAKNLRREKLDAKIKELLNE
jgi:peroxiredoxin